MIQLFVFSLDVLTPLGFAHGVLYAPAVLLGRVAGRRSVVWVLAAVGMSGVLLGMWLSPGKLPGVEDQYIILNRILGLGAVAFAALASSAVIRMQREQRAAQTELQQAAALLEVSSAVGRLGGWRMDLLSKVTNWSPEVFRLMDRAIGVVPDIDTIIGWYAPEHRQTARDAFTACLTEGRPFDVELQVLTQGGARRWVRVVGHAARDANGRIVRVQGAIQDIESFKSVQRELEHSRTEWRLMAESLPMMVWVASEDGVINYFNQFASDYTGRQVGQLVGFGWFDCLHPDDRDFVAGRWASSVESGKPYEAEFRVRRHDGEWRSNFVHAVRVRLPAKGGWRWYGTAVDVQALQDVQQARQELVDRLASTMESVTDAIFILDSEWRITFLNGQAEELLERRREDLVGRNVWDEFPAARDTVFQQQYERCVRDRVTVRFDAIYGPLGKHFEVNAYPNDGGLVVYFRDVTDSRLLAEQLQQAQRMESLGQLTGGVAHDFNNLLTVILGNAEVLAEQPGADAQQRLMAEMIAAAAKRGAEMTQRLLAFARKQALEPRPTDLNRLIRQFAPLLQRTLGEHIGIETVQAAGLWPTLVDAGQLEAAILNLAVNARDAMPTGGRLTIETANARLDELYAQQHSEVRPGQYVMLAISDTGCGIPTKRLSRVFEPFFTTKEVGKGTGLGLAMVYGFVKQSRGHVTIYSEVDRGTTIKIYLPRLHQNGEKVEGMVPALPGKMGQGELVLLVEDDDMVRAFARRQVESLGYRVIEAETGRIALRQLEDHPEVALLFTDVVMPGGMSGRQLADEARKLRPGLPVLYTSGYTENAIVHHGRLDPGVLLLGKPYLKSDLAEKLQQALAGRGVDAGRP
ncbi:PAS domain S-box protein [Xanthomonadaceae bacterium JHOS43]|nr:PAS domain S-box protein [Xanthomonadaceae bacterium JHOS43]